jgi:segregation and condensation protein A
MEERFRDQKPELVWTIGLTEFATLAGETLTPKEIPSVGLTHLHASRVSIREQAAAVVQILRSQKTSSFFELIREVKDRAIVVARFLSILELYRMNAISFEQPTPLGDLQLTWRAESFNEEQLAALGADYDD